MLTHRRFSYKKLTVLTVMSAIGLLSSSMVLIIWNALRHPLPFCAPSSTSIFDCNKVLSNQYSTIFGIPLEVFAIAYFLVNLLLIYFVGFGSNVLARLSLKVLFGWRFLGLIIVPYLIGIEVFLVKAICIYCIVMHISIIVDFGIISYLFYYRNFQNRHERHNRLNALFEP